MRAAAIVVAAGRGERFGGPVPKALVPVAGRPLVVHAVDALVTAGVAEVVVVHPAGASEPFRGVLAGWLGDADTVRLVPGGEARGDSVRAGLAEVATDVEMVAVHDAARGLQPPEVISVTLAAVGGDVVAAAPALPVTDTLKRVVGSDVVATVDRSELVGVQTPQVVLAGLLHAAHATAVVATDDLAVVEGNLRTRGVDHARIVYVPGSPLGRKVTYAEDVAAIEALLAHG